MKIILALKDGIIEVINKPDDTEIEIRDYNVWDDEIVHYDEYGSEYYMVIL